MLSQNKVKRYPLHQSQLYMLRSRRKLAAILKIDNKELRLLSKGSDALYREFATEKKGGGKRDVQSPAHRLKTVQKLLSRLLSRIQPEDYLFCPVKGRCYVSNAAVHKGQRVIHCLDVRKYFPSTSARRVFWFFHSVMKCERDIAATLIELSTYQGFLPTGSPLSPILAYYAHYDVWQNIAALCKEHGYKLTVYIDDVTISGASVSATVIWKIKEQIHRSGLRYHKEKSFYDCPAEITGVIVNGDKLAAPNRQLKKVSIVKAQIKKAKCKNEEKKLNDRLSGLHGQMKQIAAKDLQA